MDISNTLQTLRNSLTGKSQLEVGIWGDSLLQGVVLDDAAGRYRVLKENAVALCAQALKATIQNFSKFGNTVIRGKQRLMTHLEKGKTCDIAVLEFGGNDCDMPWEAISAEPHAEHFPKVPLKQFSEHIQDMIKALVSRGIVPLLATLPPLDHERYLSWICRHGLSRENILRFLGDSHRIYWHHERYSLEVSRLARENECGVVDVRAAFLDYSVYYKDLLCADGIHPNDKGQMLIREAFMAVVDRYLPSIRLSPA